MVDLVKVVVPLGTAALGFASGLLMPWVKAYFENDAARIESRRRLVASWRRAISEQDTWSVVFGDSHEYASLRVHMKSAVIRRLERPRTIIIANEARGQDARKQILFDEIARIERKWNLV